MDLKTQIVDSKFRDIAPEDATLDMIATGFSFTEGPVWCGNHLLFSDIPHNRIVKYRLLAEGPEVSTFRHPSGGANGLTLDAAGRLVTCEHNARRVTRTETDGTVSVLTDRYQGHRLNSPNDVVTRSDGSTYFSDPPYGLKDFTRWKELPCNGVYRIPHHGEPVLLADDFERPNGLAFSPDEKTLYVNDSNRKHIRAFDVSPDGGLHNGRIFVELNGEEPGGPDGMKVDSAGNVYCTGPGGIWIFDAAQNFLGRILMPEIPSNMAWGDADGKTLYITARPSVYKVRLKIPGIAVGA
ncbi:MAG: SMP-30/gluconolactonase/LRE family protein [Chloroflexota bacterium]